MTEERVERILGHYRGENPAVVGNLRRMMRTGTLAGTGKMVILPVDQGFEHGPARSFSPNPEGYDPEYHVGLAVESGCNAYAAPLGFIEAVAGRYAGVIPLILKVNNSDTLGGPPQPASALTANVEDALRLGCSAIGYTIYPGTGARNETYVQLRDLIRQARRVGLPTIVWSYPRGGNISKAGETALDVVAYGAQIACQMGAHVVKVKPPTEHIEQEAAKGSYEGVPRATLKERTEHVVKACFEGKRIVIFSGGPSKGLDDVMADVKEIAAGGGYGSILGRNAFQRPRNEAVELLRAIMAAFKNAA